MNRKYEKVLIMRNNLQSTYIVNLKVTKTMIYIISTIEWALVPQLKRDLAVSQTGLFSNRGERQ